MARQKVSDEGHKTQINQLIDRQRERESVGTEIEREEKIWEETEKSTEVRLV